VLKERIEELNKKILENKKDIDMKEVN